MQAVDPRGDSGAVELAYWCVTKDRCHVGPRGAVRRHRRFRFTLLGLNPRVPQISKRDITLVFCDSGALILADRHPRAPYFGGIKCGESFRDLAATLHPYSQPALTLSPPLGPDPALLTRLVGIMSRSLVMYMTRCCQFLV